MIELAPKSKTKLSRNSAWLYCITCTHDNKYDWRFPTDQEFNSDYTIFNLLGQKKIKPAISYT